MRRFKNPQGFKAKVVPTLSGKYKLVIKNSDGTTFVDELFEREKDAVDSMSRYGECWVETD